VILGVSRDSLKSHEKFSETLQIPFELISDRDKKLCQLFDVIKPKTMYSKSVRGIEQ
jgi:peroxiredoxin Q/BCP